MVRFVPGLASDGQFLDAAISGAGSLAEPRAIQGQGDATGTHSLNDFCRVLLGIPTHWYWVANLLRGSTRVRTGHHTPHLPLHRDSVQASRDAA